MLLGIGKLSKIDKPKMLRAEFRNSRYKQKIKQTKIAIIV